MSSACHMMSLRMPEQLYNELEEILKEINVDNKKKSKFFGFSKPKMSSMVIEAIRRGLDEIKQEVGDV